MREDGAETRTKADVVKVTPGSLSGYVVQEDGTGSDMGEKRREWQIDQR